MAKRTFKNLFFSLRANNTPRQKNLMAKAAHLSEFINSRHQSIYVRFGRLFVIICCRLHDWTRINWHNWPKQLLPTWSLIRSVRGKRQIVRCLEPRMTDLELVLFWFWSQVHKIRVQLLATSFMRQGPFCWKKTLACDVRMPAGVMYDLERFKFLHELLLVHRLFIYLAFRWFSAIWTVLAFVQEYIFYWFHTQETLSS